MKPAFATLALGALLGTAVFGVFVMHHDGDHGHGGCIAALAQGLADCPDAAGNPLGFLSFHLGAFKSFSTATFGASFGSFLALVLALFSCLIAVSSSNGFSASSFSEARVCRGRWREAADFSLRRQLARWIALHEKRDPTLPF